MRIHRLDAENFQQAMADWTLSQYEKELSRHASEYPERVAIEDDHLMEKQVLTWFMFEWINPRTRTTLAAEFIEKYIPDPKLAAKVSQIKRIFYSTFIIGDRVYDNVFNVVDQYDNKTYRVKFKNKLPSSFKDMTFSGYIHPWEDDGTYRSAGILSFSRANPYGFITPEMQNIIYRQIIKDKQDKAESVTIPHKLFTYLKNQPIELVELIAKFLDIPESKKRARIRAISKAISANGADILKSLTAEEVSCLQYVYESPGHGSKYRALEDRFGKDDYELFSPTRARSTIGQLREKGMLMVGRKTIDSRRYKVAVIPEELRPALGELEPLSEEDADPIPLTLKDAEDLERSDPPIETFPDPTSRRRRWFGLFKP